MHNDPTLTSKEKSAVLVRSYVAEIKATMDTVLSYIDQAKLVPAEVVTKLNKSQRKLEATLWNLKARSVPKKLTPEEEKKSDVQECVDAWVKEQLEERDLKPELLDDDDIESFDYTFTEYMKVDRSGCVKFTVADLAKERLEEMGMEFNDALKTHLDGCLFVDFDIDTEHGDEEQIETETELL